MEKAYRNTTLGSSSWPVSQNDPFRDAYSVGMNLPVTAALLIGLLLIPSAWAAVPSSPVPDASGYEIPIGELNKVKKERPKKKETKERKKKKGEDAAQQPSAEVVIPLGKNDNVSGKPEISTVAPVTIHHDPNSYVIAGKRTRIQAVISSTDSIQAVYCRFRATEDGDYALVPMLPVDGTHFTYAADVPGLAAASRSLRYSVLAVDSSGHEARSQEFVIAVKPSAVLPGWQLESSPGTLKIMLENKEKPLEGFSDPGIVE
jgi:hypothetical protein